MTAAERRSGRRRPAKRRPPVRPCPPCPGAAPGRYRLNPMTEYRRVGNSGLTVSVVGLGCNNLGRANTATESQEGTDAVVHAALDAGITFFDVADTYGREPGLSETMLGKALAGPPRRRRDRHQVRHGHARGQRQRLRRPRLPPLHHQGRRGLAAPARHGLDRPLPVPHPGPADPDRGDPRRPRRARHQRQGPLHRPLQPRRLADRRGRIRGPRPRRSALHLQPEPLQPAGPPRRTRGHARRRSLRPGRAAVLPARQRPADRQVRQGHRPRGLAPQPHPHQPGPRRRLGPAGCRSAPSPPNAA